MNARSLIIALLAGIAMAGGLFFALQLNAPREPVAAFVLPAPEPLPAFSLVDQSQAPFTRESLSGQWDLLFFGFTNCPDICPTTLQLLSRVRASLKTQGDSPLPRIVLLSVDPERDTPEQLAKYVAYFGEDNVGVTGSIEEVKKLTQALYVYFAKVELGNGNYTVDHSPAVLVVDPAGRYHSGFSGSHTYENLMHDLPIIMASQ